MRRFGDPFSRKFCHLQTDVNKIVNAQIFLYGCSLHRYLRGGHRNQPKSVFIFNGKFFLFLKFSIHFFIVAYEGHWSPKVRNISSSKICLPLNSFKYSYLMINFHNPGRHLFFFKFYCAKLVRVLTWNFTILICYSSLLW